MFKSVLMLKDKKEKIIKIIITLMIALCVSLILKDDYEERLNKTFYNHSYTANKYNTVLGDYLFEQGNPMSEMSQIEEFDAINSLSSVFYKFFRLGNFHAVYTSAVKYATENKSGLCIGLDNDSSYGIIGDDNGFVRSIAPLNLRNKAVIIKIQENPKLKISLMNALGEGSLSEKQGFQGMDANTDIVLLSGEYFESFPETVMIEGVIYQVVKSKSFRNLLTVSIRKNKDKSNQELKKEIENAVSIAEVDLSEIDLIECFHDGKKILNHDECAEFNSVTLLSHLQKAGILQHNPYKSKEGFINMQYSKLFFDDLSYYANQGSEIMFNAEDKSIFRNLGLYGNQDIKDQSAKNIKLKALISGHSSLSSAVLKRNLESGFFKGSSWKLLTRKYMIDSRNLISKKVSLNSQVAFASYFSFAQDYEYEAVNALNNRGHSLYGDSYYELEMPGNSLVDWSISIYDPSNKLSIANQRFDKPNNKKAIIGFSSGKCRDVVDFCFKLSPEQKWYSIVSFNMLDGKTKSVMHGNDSFYLLEDSGWRPGEIKHFSKTQLQ